jgi:hypothetical protein
MANRHADIRDYFFYTIKKGKTMNNLLKFFTTDHLPSHLQEISKPFEKIAVEMDESINDSAEKTAGLRKLLEAKDCFVRAAL